MIPFKTIFAFLLTLTFMMARPNVIIFGQYETPYRSARLRCEQDRRRADAECLRRPKTVQKTLVSGTGFEGLRAPLPSLPIGKRRLEQQSAQLLTESLSRHSSKRPHCTSDLIWWSTCNTQCLLCVCNQTVRGNIL